MTTQDEDQDTAHTSAYDPFPQPQTIPSGWDLSGLFAAPQPSDLAQGRPAPAVEEEDAADS